LPVALKKPLPLLGRGFLVFGIETSHKQSANAVSWRVALNASEGSTHLK
jgi:hypothetical protein